MVGPSSGIKSPATMDLFVAANVRAAVALTRVLAAKAACWREPDPRCAQAAITAVVPARTSPWPPHRRGAPGSVLTSTGASPAAMRSTAPLQRMVAPWWGISQMG